MVTFNLDKLSVVNQARANKCLDKLFRFSGRVMSLRAFIEENGKDKVEGDNAYKYDRRKFNRMDAAQQKKYEASLAKPAYFIKYGDCLSVEVPKLVYDIVEFDNRNPE